MTLKERVKQVRKDAKMKQEEFGEKIGISGASVAKIEKGTNNPSERTIKLICSEFNVNYLWLTEGIGQMYADYRGAILDELTDGFNLDALDRKIVAAYLDMTPAEREGLKILIKRIKDGEI